MKKRIIGIFAVLLIIIGLTACTKEKAEIFSIFFKKHLIFKNNCDILYKNTHVHWGLFGDKGKF